MDLIILWGQQIGNLWSKWQESFNVLYLGKGGGGDEWMKVWEPLRHKVRIHKPNLNFFFFFIIAMRQYPQWSITARARWEVVKAGPGTRRFTRVHNLPEYFSCTAAQITALQLALIWTRIIRASGWSGYLQARWAQMTPFRIGACTCGGQSGPVCVCLFVFVNKVSSFGCSQVW